jgi:hypothetical protein
MVIKMRKREWSRSECRTIYRDAGLGAGGVKVVCEAILLLSVLKDLNLRYIQHLYWFLKARARKEYV